MVEIFPIILILTMMIYFTSLFYDLITLISLVEMSILSIGLVKNWYHIVMIMILLELMSIVVFKLISIFGTSLMNMNLLFFYMSFMVIEASLGMALIVVNSRSAKDEMSNY